MVENTTVDKRDMNTKTTMAKFFADERKIYEEQDSASIVYEDDDIVIVADHKGLELNEWADNFDIERNELRETFRVLADEKMGEKRSHEVFSYSDPIVFDKIE